MKPSFKVVTLGDSQVGKTSLSMRFGSDTFRESLGRTVNAAVLVKDVTFGNTTVKLNLWDTAGEEKYSALAPNYYRDAVGALIVFDVTEPASFDRVVSWVDELKQHAPEHCVLAIAANKIDKPDREVTRERAAAYAEQQKVLYYEVSAKTGHGVRHCYEALAEKVWTVQQANAAPKEPSRQRTGRARSLRLEAEPRARSQPAQGGCCKG